MISRACLPVAIAGTCRRSKGSAMTAHFETFPSESPDLMFRNGRSGIRLVSQPTAHYCGGNPRDPPLMTCRGRQREGQGSRVKDMRAEEWREWSLVRRWFGIRRLGMAVGSKIARRSLPDLDAQRGLRVTTLTTGCHNRLDEWPARRRRLR